MKNAFGVVQFDGIIALGRLVVAGLDLRSNWILAKRNPVRLDDILAASQVHLAFRLFYENVVNGRGEHGFLNPIRPKTWSNPERPLLFLCRCRYRINEMMFLRLYRIRATVIVLEFSSTQ